MFLQVSVILSTEGRVSQHALQVVSKHALHQVSKGGGCIPVCIAGGSPACPATSLQGGCVSQHALQQVSRAGVYPSMPCSRSLGGCLGPHPRGKLRGIRSRPTPKGEIEGDQIQAAGMHPTGMHSCYTHFRVFLRQFCHFCQRLRFNKCMQKEVFSKK